MEKLVVYAGLYGESTYQPMLEFIHVEPLEARSKMYNWEIQEHLHTDLLQFFFIKKGKGILISEKSEINLEGPCLIFIPANTLHGFSFYDLVEGDVITFAESIFLESFKQNQIILSEFNHLKNVNFLNIASNYNEIEIFKNLIIKEISEENPEKRLYVNSLFKLLILAAFRQIKESHSPISETENKTLYYFKEFQKLIKIGYSETKTVYEYAQDIGISTMHLNRVCKSVMNQSPIQIIQNYLVIQAKKYLLNTSYTISEISYFLNFNDPAYFTRMFKKNVGVSPSDFRKG